MLLISEWYALIDTMKKSVDELTGDAEQFDDLTMLCVRYYGQR